MIRKIIKNYYSSFTGLPKKIWVLATVLFVNRSGSMVLFFLALYLTKKMGFSIALAGKLLSVYGAGAIVGSYCGGWMSDKIGYSRVQLFSLFLSGIAYITVIFWETALPIGINLFILAVLAESFRPANATNFVKFAPQTIRSRAFAVQRLAINLGVAVGPALGGFIARYNYDYLFWIDGLTCIAAGIMHFFLLHKNSATKQKSNAQCHTSTFFFIKDKIFLFLIVFAFILSLFFHQVISTWPVYLKEVLSFPEDQIGLLLAINTLLIVVFEIPTTHNLEKFRPLPIIALGTFLFCLSFGILPFGATYLYVIFTVVIWTFGEILIFPNLSALVANRAPANKLGQYMGCYSFAFSLSLAIAPTLGSTVYNYFGPRLLWFGIGGMGALLVIGLLLTRYIFSLNHASHRKN